jgi:hypothetical protein
MFAIVCSDAVGCIFRNESGSFETETKKKMMKLAANKTTTL